MVSTLSRFLFALGVPLGIWSAVAPSAMFQGVGEDPPELIRIQTRLTDATGLPLNNDFEIDIDLFTAETGGDLLFSEKHVFFDPALGNYAITDGFVDIVLGSGVTLAGFFPDFSVVSSVWAEFTITSLDPADALGNDPPLTPGEGGLAGPEVLAPRLRLTSVPYALSAKTVADAAITNEKLADNAVTTEKIQDGTVAGIDVQDESLTGADVLDGSLTSADVQDESLTGADVLDGSLTGADVLDGSLTSADVQDESLTGDDVLDGSLTGADVQDASLTGADVLDGSLTGADVQDESLTGADVQDGSLTGADVQDESLTGADVLNGSIAGFDLTNPLDLSSGGNHVVTHMGPYTNRTLSGGLGVVIDSTTDGAGDLGVFDQFQNQRIWLDGKTGTIAGTVKAFVEPDPGVPGQTIWYAAVESPTPQLQVKGTANLIAGQAVIELPRHFAVLAKAGSLTVHLTPRSADTFGLAVVESTPHRVVVRELAGGKGTFAFDYLVIGSRARLMDWPTLRPSK